MDNDCGHSTDKFDQQELGGFSFSLLFSLMAVKTTCRGQRGLINLLLLPGHFSRELVQSSQPVSGRCSLCYLQSTACCMHSQGADVLAFRDSVPFYMPLMLKSPSGERLVYFLRGFFRQEIFGHRGAVYNNRRKKIIRIQKSPVAPSPS